MDRLLVVLVVVLSWSAVTCWLVILSRHFWYDGLSTDNDSLMRTSMLEWGLSHGSVATHFFPRDGAPGASAFHWTLPFDAVLLALAYPVSIFQGWHRGFLFALRIMPSLAAAADIASACWLCSALGFRRAVPWTALSVSTMGAAVAYGATAPGTHHALSGPIAVAMVASAVSLVRFGGRARATLAAAFFVLCSWNTIESVPEVALAAAIVAAGVIRRPGRVTSFRFFAAILAVLAVVPMVVDPDPSGTLLAHDRYSLLHVVSLWTFASLVAASPTLAKMRRFRLAAVLLAAAVPTLCLLAVSPPLEAFGDPLFRFHFLRMSADLKSAWYVEGARQDMEAVTVVLALACWTAFARKGSRGLALRAMVAALAALVIQAWAYDRLAQYGEISSCVAFGALCAWCVSPLGRIHPRLPAWLAVAAGVVSLSLEAFLLVAIPVQPKLYGNSCAVGRKSAEIIERTVGDKTILADFWTAPEVLARTTLPRVVAGPYHRDWLGISDVVRVLDGSQEDVVRGILARRHASFLLACLDEKFLEAGLFSQRSLAATLYFHADPPWLERIPIPSQDLGFYRVR
jgi:hypothetical protein